MNPPIDLDHYILELKRNRDELLEQQDELNFQVEDIERQINMVQMVRRSYLQHYRLPMPTNEGVDDYLNKKFARLSIKDMLIRIAQDADGVLDLAHARHLLVRAGLFKDERSATTSIVPVLGRHEDIFRRVSRGVYIIIGKQSVKENPPAPAAFCITAMSPSAVHSKPFMYTTSYVHAEADTQQSVAFKAPPTHWALHYNKEK